MERNTLMNCKHFSVISALLLFSLMSFAATKPLNSPQGLALDSKGNLYVANNGGSQILIYGSAYAQMTAKTISKGVISPSSVVVDALGNILVATLSGGPSATGTVTEYSSTGVLTDTFTDGIDYPYAIATDGIDPLNVTTAPTNITSTLGLRLEPARDDHNAERPRCEMPPARNRSSSETQREVRPNPFGGVIFKQAVRGS